MQEAAETTSGTGDEAEELHDKPGGFAAPNINLNLPGNNEHQLLLTIVANPNNLQRGLLDQGNGFNNLAGSVRRLERSLNHLVR